ncbi:MAG: SagB/ThcOx family dehydrogenase [Planctomycetota bacterium]
MPKDINAIHRDFLKDYVRQEIDFSSTDQYRGVAAPPIQKPYSDDKEIVKLPAKDEWSGIGSADLAQAIEERVSHRHFKSDFLSIDELSFLLWATQGIKECFNDATALRTVPSAGCRHCFETYLAVINVENLEQGIYRYLPIEHSIIFEHAVDNIFEKLDSGTLGQSFVSTAAVTFIWAAIPYRMEWRYSLAAHRVILMDVGHVCQNLYLACSAIGSGTCAIAAYDQDKMNELIKADGEDEFTVYLAPVGKV